MYEIILRNEVNLVSRWWRRRRPVFSGHCFLNKIAVSLCTRAAGETVGERERQSDRETVSERESERVGERERERE